MGIQQEHALSLEVATRVFEEESRAIRSHRYSSLKNKKNDLKYCQECYDEARGLLETYDLASLADNKQLSHMYERVWEVARGTVFLAYGALKNLRLRREYLHITGSLTKLSNRFLTELYNMPGNRRYTTLDPPITVTQNNENVELMLAKFQTRLEEMEGLLAEWGTRSYPALKPRAFSKDWRETFNKIRTSTILRYNNSIYNSPKNYPLSSELTEIKTAYQIDIIAGTYKSLEENGTQLMQVFRSAGESLALLTAVIMVWQIFQSNHRLEASARAAFSIPPALLAGYVGAEAGAWLLGIVSGPGGALLGAIFGGLIGGFAGGLAADSLFDAILYYLSSSTPDLLISRLFGPPLYYELTLPDSCSLTKKLIDRMI